MEEVHPDRLLPTEYQDQVPPSTAPHRQHTELHPSSVPLLPQDFTVHRDFAPDLHLVNTEPHLPVSAVSLQDLELHPPPMVLLLLGHHLRPMAPHHSALQEQHRHPLNMESQGSTQDHHPHSTEPHLPVSAVSLQDLKLLPLPMALLLLGHHHPLTALHHSALLEQDRHPLNMEPQDSVDNLLHRLTVLPAGTPE